MEPPETSSHVRVFDQAGNVAVAAANGLVAIAKAAIAERGRFTVALSGGSTPTSAYQLLASEKYKSEIDWSKTHIFFGDERSVPPDDPQSNYRMVNEALLSRVLVPVENIHRIKGVGDVVANARLYEDEMRTYFDEALFPRLDLVLLGMGEDGHTASLFPGTPALQEQSAWVTANWVEKLAAHRITLTAPAINHAAHIIFLVTGQNKAERLREVLEGEYDPARLPAQLIKPVDGSLEWFIDKAASASLSPE